MLHIVLKKIQSANEFFSKNRSILFVGGGLFLVGGLAYVVISKWLNYFYINLLGELKNGYWPSTDGSHFKREIISFVIIQSLLVVLALFALLYRHYFAAKYKRIAIPNLLFFLGFIFGLAGLFIFKDGHLRIFFLLAALTFVSSFFIYISRPIEFLFNFLSSNFSSKYIKSSFLFITSFALLLALLIPGYKAWYPLALPNDYYEAPSSFIIKDATGEQKGIDFFEAKNYLEKNQSSSLKSPAYRELFSAFDAANSWSQETGRILYHHSYVLVPAKHWLKYGLDNSVLYLYGYGNTIAYALLIGVAGGSISSYFAIYPISLLLGLLIMCIAIAYCSKSKAITFLSAIVGIYFLYQVGYTAALLAFSFSSMRFVGLFIQIVAIFYYLRRPSVVGSGAMFFSSLFSLFWNGEFGLFGVLGQVLAFIPSSPDFSWKRRVLGGLFLIALPITFRALTPSSETFINSVYLGFFQVNMPYLTGEQGVWLILILLSIQLVLVFLCFYFKGAERFARLCVLPILALSLLKIFYNPSAPHAAITFFFIAPLLLLYLPVSLSSSKLFLNFKISFYLILLGVVGLFCWKSAARYEDESNYIRKYLVAPVVTRPWISLGESLPIALNQEDIQGRVESIRKYIEPNDTVLFLSPFDHLLSFYINPKGFCGHFELISNLALKQDLNKVAKCVKNANSHVLIVLDDALTIPCPDLKKLNLENSCSKKLQMKKNVAEIMDHLPALRKQGQEGGLTFFRPEAQ